MQKEEARFCVQLREAELVAAVPLALEPADVAARAGGGATREVGAWGRELRSPLERRFRPEAEK